MVAGGTGLIGGEVLAQLAGRSDVTVSALVRRAGTRLPAGVREVVFDYESAASYAAIGADVACDVLLCCLGTTRKQAGSDEAFRRVDRDYPIRLLERLGKLPGQPVFGLVSSIGADRPSGLYLETKAAVEQAVRQSGRPYAIVRPSLLLGNRTQSRVGEEVATVVMKPLFGLLRSISSSDTIARYAPIEGAQVARALIAHAVDQREPHDVVSGQALFDAR